MGLYTRQQLVLLLLLLAAAGVGLGVSHWRAAHPQLVERLERLDREITATEEVKAQDREVEAQVREVTRTVETGAPRRRPRDESNPRPPARPRAAKPRAHQLDEPGPPLDLNRATLADLMHLPGVGPVLARRILETREAAGKFGAVDDLVIVRGLGSAKLERLRPFVGIVE